MRPAVGRASRARCTPAQTPPACVPSASGPLRHRMTRQPSRSPIGSLPASESTIQSPRSREAATTYDSACTYTTQCVRAHDLALEIAYRWATSHHAKHDSLTILTFNLVNSTGSHISEQAHTHSKQHQFQILLCYSCVCKDLESGAHAAYGHSKRWRKHGRHPQGCELSDVERAAPSQCVGRCSSAGRR